MSFPMPPIMTVFKGKNSKLVMQEKYATTLNYIVFSFLKLAETPLLKRFTPIKVTVSSVDNGNNVVYFTSFFKDSLNQLDSRNLTMECSMKFLDISIPPNFDILEINTKFQAIMKSANVDFESTYSNP